MTVRLTVSVVDDDESVRESLMHLLKSIGMRGRAFRSAEEFLNSDAINSSDCIILDVTMPGMSGPALQGELRQRGNTTPVIFVTALEDETIRDLLVSKGARACLFKPLSDTDLIQALTGATSFRL